jgi:hypothetical protein
MSDLYLDLSDKREMINFLSHWLAFADSEYRKHAESFIADYDNGKNIEVVELQNFTKEFATEILSIRLALTDFFANQGAGIEWNRVENTVRRSTALKMRKFKASGEAETIDQLFHDDDFDVIFNEDEKMEIQHVRHQLIEEYYLSNKNKIQGIIAEMENVFNKFNDLIFELRECAAVLPTMLQEELYSKITRYEDRFYFNGESIDENLLKEELQYYTEHKEVPIE